MKFDFERFARDHRVPSYTSGHKQCQPGWVQLNCPYCSGNPGPHLGFNLREGYFNCWRCGFHRTTEVISSVLSCSDKEAFRIMKQYESTGPIRILGKIKHIDGVRKEAKFPSGTTKLKKRHKRYLKSRGFDPDKLEEIWDLKGTGMYGDYKYRIIVPIYHGGRRVSFQGRDVTDKQELKYKACQQEKEARYHKRCLYGLNLLPDKDAVVVEGVTDVWRLGPGAIATFGISYTKAQVRLLGKLRNKYILYDSADPQAVAQGEKLANELSFYPGNVEIIEIDERDPAEMTPWDADKLMQELLT